jgi:hypothetical protein
MSEKIDPIFADADLEKQTRAIAAKHGFKDEEAIRTIADGSNLTMMAFWEILEVARKAGVVEEGTESERRFALAVFENSLAVTKVNNDRHAAREAARRQRSN